MVVFLHQDILFEKPKFLEVLIRYVEEGPLGVYGLAGSLARKKNRIIRQEWTEKPGFELREVFSLDECLFVMRRELLDKCSFDQETCDGWHLYAVDFCCQCRVAGFGSFLLPAGARHLSGGNQDKAFYESEAKLAEKYKNRFPMIFTTCTWFYTGLLYRPFSVFRAIRRNGLMPHFSKIPR